MWILHVWNNQVGSVLVCHITSCVTLATTDNFSRSWRGWKWNPLPMAICKEKNSKCYKPWEMPEIWCQVTAPYLQLWEKRICHVLVFINGKGEVPLLVMILNPGLTSSIHVELLVPFALFLVSFKPCLLCIWIMAWDSIMLYWISHDHVIKCWKILQQDSTTLHDKDHGKSRDTRNKPKHNEGNIQKSASN